MAKVEGRIAKAGYKTDLSTDEEHGLWEIEVAAPNGTRNIRPRPPSSTCASSVQSISQRCGFERLALLHAQRRVVPVTRRLLAASDLTHLVDTPAMTDFAT